MTYGGKITNVLTLAHELGHAFHNFAMKSVNGMNKQYPISIAETASFFSEMIILDAAMEKAESTDEKLFLLDEKLKRSVMNFMNIHSRFLFEKKLYDERKEGIISSSRLNELMQEAIDEGYEDSIENASSPFMDMDTTLLSYKIPILQLPIYIWVFIFFKCLCKGKGNREGI